MSNKIFNKKCEVCGDKALGKNFDALSCESCKAFFRRTALKNTELKCEFNDNCKIDVFTRRFCMKCRLRKCFDIGMKKEMILSVDAKKERLMRIEMNKKRRKNSYGSVGHSSDSQSSPESGEQLSSNSGDETNHEFSDDPINFDELLDLDLDADDINQEIMNIENYINVDKDNDGVDDQAVEQEFSLLPIARPVVNNFSLNEMEMNKLTELLNATTFFNEMTTSLPVPIVDDKAINGVIFGKFEQQLKRSVKMCKTFQSFQSIGETDKMTLIKEGIIDLYCIRSITTFDHLTNQWIFVMDTDNSYMVDLETFKMFPHNMYEYFKNFLHSISKVWESDSVVLDLLTAIVLFNPNRPNIERKEYLRLQQNIYMYLLQRYLAVRYQSQTDSTVKFLQLLNSLTDLYTLGQKLKDSFSQKDPDKMPPLIRELFVTNATNAIKYDNCHDTNATSIVF